MPEGADMMLRAPPPVNRYLRRFPLCVPTQWAALTAMSHILLSLELTDLCTLWHGSRKPRLSSRKL